MLIDSVTVVVVVFETSPVLLARCLSSARSMGMVSGVDVEILVVDNSLTRALETQFGKSVDRWLSGHGNVGFGRAANMGVIAARGQWTLLLNPDAALKSTTLAALEGGVDGTNTDRALFCGWLHKADGVQVDAYMHWWSSTGRLLRRSAYKRYLSRSEFRRLVSVQKVSGGALFARTSTLLVLGPFDERFFLYGEDADLSVRATRLGYKLFAIPAAVVEHVGASSQSEHSILVERARVDAAIRIARYHLAYAMSLIVQVDVLLVSLAGVLFGRAGSSGSLNGRRQRIAILRRWSWHRDQPVFDPNQSA